MNRQEFIESCKTKSEAELLEIAKNSRIQAERRLPEETRQKFRLLDDVTEVDERYEGTAYGKTHLFLVRQTGKTGDLPVIINVHGGGWSLDHTERDIYFSRRMANRLGALVVDLDYVLAPEYPYPAALEELEALLDVLPERLPEWGGDKDRIILCGQSAGGNLVAAVLERGKFTEKLKPLAQILCYLPTDNYLDHFHGEELDERGMSTEYYGFFYNRTFEERKNFDVSLVYSTPDQMRKLPPTHILTAGMDPLMQEGRQYYELLKKNGVACSYRCFEDSRHGFLVNLYDEFQEGEDYVASLMEQALG